MTDALPDRPLADRRHWMAVLARAEVDELGCRLDAGCGVPPYHVLRGPESGLVMVRGRTGGGGAPFNLGEMTTTRCTVRSEDGFVGHAYVVGRNERLAELAALADALLQDPEHRPHVMADVIGPLAAAQLARREAVAAKAAATRVEFFAMRNMRT